MLLIAENKKTRTFCMKRRIFAQSIVQMNSKYTALLKVYFYLSKSAALFKQLSMTIIGTFQHSCFLLRTNKPGDETAT